MKKEKKNLESIYKLSPLRKVRVSIKLDQPKRGQPRKETVNQENATWHVVEALGNINSSLRTEDGVFE